MNYRIKDTLIKNLHNEDKLLLPTGLVSTFSTSETEKPLLQQKVAKNPVSQNVRNREVHLYSRAASVYNFITSIPMAHFLIIILYVHVYYVVAPV